jgi:hypothetical protein
MAKIREAVAETWEYNLPEDSRIKEKLPVPKAVTSDEYDVGALRAEITAMAQERQQERAEVALLRAQVARYEDTAKETEAQRNKFLEFLAWVALSAEQKTQLVADRIYKDAVELGGWWEVQLQEMPRVKLRAHSEYEAVGRYNELCGITGTAHKHTAAPVLEAA